LHILKQATKEEEVVMQFRIFFSRPRL